MPNIPLKINIDTLYKIPILPILQIEIDIIDSFCVNEFIYQLIETVGLDKIKLIKTNRFDNISEEIILQMDYNTINMFFYYKERNDNYAFICTTDNKIWRINLDDFRRQIIMYQSNKNISDDIITILNNFKQTGIVENVSTKGFCSDPSGDIRRSIIIPT
jgi:hypothetical protein